VKISAFSNGINGLAKLKSELCLWHLNVDQEGEKSLPSCLQGAKCKWSAWGFL